jgi:hypothetical protein
MLRFFIWVELTPAEECRKEIGGLRREVQNYEDSFPFANKYILGCQGVGTREFDVHFIGYDVEQDSSAYVVSAQPLKSF